MRTSWIVVMAAACVWAGPALAGPLDVARVPASAQWVMHADIEGLLASKVGAFLLEQVAKPDAAAGLAVFKNMSGLDLTKDLRGITLYGAKTGQPDGVALIEGRFDQEKLLTLLRTNETLKEIKVGDAAAYQWTENPKAQHPGPERFGAFHSDRLIVMASSLDLLKTALAVLDKKADSLAGAPASARPSPTAGTFLGVYVASLPDAGADKAGSTLLNKLASGRLEIGQADNNFFLRLTAAARDAQTAAELGRVVDGGLAFLNLMKDVQQDGKPVMSPEAAAVLKDIKVAVQGSSTEVSLVTPAENVVALLRWAAAQKAAARQGHAQER